MKITTMMVAISLVGSLAVGSASVNAQEFSYASTGASHLTGVDTNDDGYFVSINHGVSILLDREGKKTRKRVTSVARNELLPWDELSLCFDHPSGLEGGKLLYLSSTTVVTVENGDQFYVELDTDPNFESYFCGRSDTIEDSVVLNRIITGGTGSYENSCGYVNFVGTTRVVGGLMGTSEGVNTGEIFDSTTVAPGTVHGCP